MQCSAVQATDLNKFFVFVCRPDYAPSAQSSAGFIFAFSYSSQTQLSRQKETECAHPPSKGRSESDVASIDSKTMRSMSFQDLFVKSSATSESIRLPPATSLLSPSSAFDGIGGYDTSAAAVTTPKGSIDFILDDASHAAVKVELSSVPGAQQTVDQELRMAAPTSSAKQCLTETDAAAPAPKRKKRKARICKEPGCDKYVVDHGLCIRHGVGS